MPVLDKDRVLAIFVASGAFAALAFVLDWAGYVSKFEWTTRYFSDIWWHFPVMWLLLCVVFLVADAIGLRLS